MAIVLALASALAYGAADFVGGLASRTRSALAVAVTSAAVGVVVFSLAGGVVPGVASGSAILWGAASGVAGMSAAACLYAALAIGPMSLVAPLTATISGVTPVVWSIVSGELPDATTWVGLVLVLAGATLISLISGETSTGSRRNAIALAVLAGLLFGAFYIFLAETPADSGMIPLIASRVAGLVVLAIALGARALRSSRSRGFTLAGMLPAVATGLLDACANAFYVFAVRDGALAVIAVIVSLYPAATVALSAIVLRERIRPVQWVGVAVALGGVAMLAL